MGGEREQKTKTIWVRGTASAKELSAKILEAFGWSEHIWSLSFQYANGRHMRPASLADIENSTSWDAETAKALMGTGCLYVVRTALKEDFTESEVHVHVAMFVCCVCER